MSLIKTKEIAANAMSTATSWPSAKFSLALTLARVWSLSLNQACLSPAGLPGWSEPGLEAVRTSGSQQASI